MAKKPENKNYKVIAENRRARYDFAIDDDIEVGIILTGSEVKSLRIGQSNIADSYASVDDGELWLTNAYIAPYDRAMFGHEERRKRKLLVKGRELARLWNATKREGMTLVPLVMYFNDRGLVKLKIATAKGTIHAEHVVNCGGLWAREVEAASALEREQLADGSPLAPLRGNEADPLVLAQARSNAEAAGVAPWLQLQAGDRKQEKQQRYNERDWIVDRIRWDAPGRLWLQW